MSMTISGHAAASGFEAPLEVLSGCHRRVERQCATLRRLVAHLLERDPDEDARAAAAAVMRCFDTATRDHHADEEMDLSVRYQINKNFEAYFDGSNLTNQGARRYGGNGLYPIEYEKFGPRYVGGVRFKF